MESPTPVSAPLTLEEFLKTKIGRAVPPVTRSIASKLESGDAPEQIARALGIAIETVNSHIKVIECFPCRSGDEKFMEEEQQEEDLERFAAVLHKAVATGEPKTSAVEVMSPSSPVAGEAAQRARVLEYLDSPTSGKLSAGARRQLRMWAEGASQQEVGRKLDVDQGNLSRRIKAVLNEAYKAELAAVQLEKSMLEAQQEETLENQRREEALRKAVQAGDMKQINSLLSRHPRHNDAMHRATTGGKTHERWAVDPHISAEGRKVGPAGQGPDR